MPDEIDRIVEHGEVLLARQIEAARPRGEGSDICVDCEAEIPARRRQQMPSATRCVACQEAAEAAARRLPR